MTINLDKDLKCNSTCSDTETMFEQRPRGTYQEVIEAAKRPSNQIGHIIKNDDGTYSLMQHCVCEFCDYCNIRNKVTSLGVASDDREVFLVFKARENPYSGGLVDTIVQLLQKRDEDGLRAGERYSCWDEKDGISESKVIDAESPEEAAKIFFSFFVRRDYPIASEVAAVIHVLGEEGELELFFDSQGNIVPSNWEE